MIFAPWKSFLAPFLPWLWFPKKKALENDFRTLKIVFGTVSSMAHLVIICNNRKNWTRTGSNRFAQRTEPNRTATAWNRTEPVHFTNRTADIPVSQNRTEPNRTGGFLAIGCISFEWVGHKLSVWYLHRYCKPTISFLVKPKNGSQKKQQTLMVQLKTTFPHGVIPTDQNPPAKQDGFRAVPTPSISAASCAKRASYVDFAAGSWRRVGLLKFVEVSERDLRFVGQTYVEKRERFVW